MDRITLTDKRDFRLTQLLSEVGHYITDDKAGEIAGRILNNMAMSLDLQEKHWNVKLTSLLKRPLPFDAANPFKEALYMEMMPSVGNHTFHKKIWKQLEVAFDIGQQNGKFIALLVGVSGVGKTKTAYDIGKANAFSIITRIVERDTLTMPWTTYSKLLNNVAVVGKSNLVEKCSLVSCLILLLVAHLQYTLDVSISATKHNDFAHMVEVRRNEMQCTEAEATDLVLKEVVLRCQRNGLAYSQVNARYQKLLHEALKQTDFITVDGVFAVELQYVGDIFLKEVARAKEVWGQRSKIVWFYDEIQASLSTNRSDQDLFAGVFRHFFGREEGPSDSHPTQGGRKCNLFYGILVAIRCTLQIASHGHVLLGNNMNLTPEFLDINSPAQGCSVSYEEKFILDEVAILTMFSTYLSDAAMEVIDRSLVRRLCGRPLFMAYFWTCIISCARKSRDPSIELGEVVNTALRSAYDRAIVDAEFRIHQMWNTYSPTAHSATAMGGLMTLLYHSIVMNTGGGGIERMRAELKLAILRGILNCTGTENTLTLDSEPITKAAFVQAGHARVLQNTDGVMESLAARMKGPMGSEACDFGEVLEACFSWYLVRKCIVAGRPVNLKILLKPFLASHISCNLSAEQLEDYDVSIESGHRWNCDDHDNSPLSTLKTHPRCLIHHPGNNMAGPDVMHVATDRHNQHRTIPIFYQLKNTQTETISEAMASLNLGRMHPNRSGETESAPHRSMRRVLEEDRNWLEPMRILVTCRSFEPALLHHIAWFNNRQLKRTPVVLLTVNKRNLGIDMLDTDTAYGAPRNWRCLWSTTVKHSNLRSPVEDIPPNFNKVSLSVKISWKMIPIGEAITKRMIKDAVFENYGAVVTNVVKSRTTFSAILTFEYIEDAFKIVSADNFRIGGKDMLREFT